MPAADPPPNPQPDPTTALPPTARGAARGASRFARRHGLAPITLVMRIALHAVGWSLVLLGVIGWFLPMLQGWLTLFLGLAVLSVASQSFHAFLRKRFRGWPRGW